MVTPETLTDEQIHVLHQRGRIRAFTAAAALGISYPTNVDHKPPPDRVQAARDFCVAVINAEAK
jgi:ureidoglycolate hydrolase